MPPHPSVKLNLPPARLMAMLSIIRVLFFVIPLLALMGGACWMSTGVGIPQHAMIGVYDQLHALGSTTLKLRADGSFSQQINLGGKPQELEGFWLYWPERQTLALGPVFVFEQGELRRLRFRVFPVARVLYLPDNLPVPIMIAAEPPFYKR
ncbi:hypothetical protein [Meiothermus sp.]|uniref:hypothetical protein n=1 Tax=Meiothermus sp. TaxID=1955249 RepID=UPI00307EAB5A